MARILLLSLVFPPDSVSTSILFGELAVELQALGHEITVLSTTPHYNKDPDALALQPLKRRWGGLLYQSNYCRIPVYHASIHLKGNCVGRRLLDYAQFHTISAVAGLASGRGYDLILAPSPPLTIGLSAWLLGLVHRIPFIYNVQEIYPDVAVSLGVLHSRFLIRAISSLECFIYARAKVVVVISEWFHRRLQAKGVPAQKLLVIPNFVDTEFIKPGDRRNPFAKAQRLEDKFVVLYAGNIGLTQSFETITAAAGKLAHLSDLRFLIVGDGTRRAWLKKELEQKELSNVRLLRYQPRSVVPQIYASSDVCLVPLKRGTAQATFPSKIYTIMAAGRPAVVSADNDSELASVVQQAGCGLVTPPSDADALVTAIEYAYHHRAELYEMGHRGRDYVVAHHSRQVIARQYHKLISEVLLPAA